MYQPFAPKIINEKKNKSKTEKHKRIDRTTFGSIPLCDPEQENSHEQMDQDYKKNYQHYTLSFGILYLNKERETEQWTNAKYSNT